jgi:hypothetical protein
VNKTSPPSTQTRSRLVKGETGPSDSALAAASGWRLHAAQPLSGTRRAALLGACARACAPRRYTPSVESPFATVRLRTTAAKRFKKVENATALIWKILQVAESTFRRLKGAEVLPAVYAGALYVDGVQRPTRTRQQMAA